MPQEVTVGCRFLVFQSRVEYENYTFIGRRTDLLRRNGDFLADRAARTDPGTERVAGEESEHSVLREMEMIELIAVPVGAKLSLIGDITAEVIEKIDDEWVKVRLIDGAGGQRRGRRRRALPRNGCKGRSVTGSPRGRNVPVRQTHSFGTDGTCRSLDGADAARSTIMICSASKPSSRTRQTSRDQLQAAPLRPPADRAHPCGSGAVPY